MHLRVLTIDDDAIDRNQMKRLLRGTATDVGTTSIVTEASDLDSALLILDQQKIDVILLDYQLPPYDGIQALARLRAAGHQQPVVVVTGHSDQAAAVALLHAGAADYLTKDQLPAERLRTTLTNAVAAAHERSRRASAALALRGLAEISADPQSAPRLVLAALAPPLGLRHAAVLVRGAQAEPTVAALWSGGAAIDAAGLLYLPAGQTWWAALATGPLHIPRTVLTHAQGDEIHRLHGDCHALAMTDRNGEILGALVALCVEDAALAAEQADLLALAATRLAHDLGRAAAERSAAQARAAQAGLAVLAEELLLNTVPSRTMPAAIERLRGATGSRKISVWWREPRTWAEVASAPAAARGKERRADAAAFARLAQVLCDGGQWLLAPGQAKEAEAEAWAWPVAERKHLAALALPMYHQGRFAAALIVEAARPTAWSGDEVRLYQNCADILAAHLDRHPPPIASA